MMRAQLLVLPLLAVLLAGTPVAAMGQLYKWIDAEGGVNYGDAPPKDAKNVRPVGNAGSLTVVPGIPQDERDRLRQREEQQRLQKLERELEELRAREEARANAPPEVIYTDVYIPTYGGGYWPTPPHARPPGTLPGHPERPIGKPRPEHPIAKPRPPARTQPVEELPETTVARERGTMIRR